MSQGVRYAVIVCGPREVIGDARAWHRAIAASLRAFPADTIVLHGGARGMDSLAAGVAIALELEVRKYPADWNVNGRSAGYVRNDAMLKALMRLRDEEGMRIGVIAYTDDRRGSPGTAAMLEVAERHGVPTHVRGRER